MGIKKNMKKKIKTALISVSDKNNLASVLKELSKNKIKIISSGGTFNKIKKMGYDCKEIKDFTNFPEILDGRVKTLHPKIYAGILNKRDSSSHKKEMRKYNFNKIDLVIVNFYPFEDKLKKTYNHDEIIENIDIGGPSIVRAAAKNYRDVVVISSSKQYEELINQIRSNNGKTTIKFREKMSSEAFLETAAYDSQISDYFMDLTKNTFPDKKIIFAKKFETLRYGENPHQKSALYMKDNERFTRICLI